MRNRRLASILALVTLIFSGPALSEKKCTKKSFQISLNDPTSFAEVEHFLREQLNNNGADIRIETSIDGEIVKSDQLTRTTDRNTNEATLATARPNTTATGKAPPTQTSSPDKKCPPPEPQTGGCRQTILTLPRDKNKEDYVLYNGSIIPELTNVSICTWISPDKDAEKIEKGAVVSYYKYGSQHGNTLRLLFRNDKKLELAAHSGKKAEWDVEQVKTRTHFCVVLSTTNKTATLYTNGTFTAQKEVDMTTTIPGAGALVIGNEQDGASDPTTFVGPMNEPDQAFRGSIEGFHIWSRILTETEIINLHKNCTCPRGYIVGIDKDNVELHGQATQSSGTECN